MNTKLENSTLQPEKIAYINGELVVFQENMERYMKDIGQEIKEIYVQIDKNEKQANEYFLHEIEKLTEMSMVENQRLDKSLRNLQKEMTNVRHRHSQAPEIENWPPPPIDIAAINSIDEAQINPNPSNSINDEPMTQESCDILIIGDSIIKGIEPAKFHAQRNTKIEVFRGGKIEDIANYFSKTSLRIKEQIIVHVGTNDVASSRNVDTILQDLESLNEKIKAKYPNVKIAISVILPRQKNLNFNRNYKLVNQGIRQLARKANRRYINHFEIEKKPNALEKLKIPFLNEKSSKTHIKCFLDCIMMSINNQHLSPQTTFKEQHLFQQQPQTTCKCSNQCSLHFNSNRIFNLFKCQLQSINNR